MMHSNNVLEKTVKFTLSNKKKKDIIASNASIRISVILR